MEREPKDKVIKVRVSEELKKLIEAEATKINESDSVVIRLALKEFFDLHGAIASAEERRRKRPRA